MTGTEDLENLYSVMEKTAGLLDITPSRDTVWPILTAYQEFIPQAVIAFRVATRKTGELDCRFTAFPQGFDPYAHAVSHGLTARTDHPVGSLLAELEERFPIPYHGADFGLVGGFTKTWTFFPIDNLQKLSDLADVPSMPSSLVGNREFYARYGLDDKFSMVGIDYPSRTVNVYFVGAPAECREPETIRAMMRDIGLPEPSEKMLKHARQAGGIYTTLSWDSPEIQRITFAALLPDIHDLPARFDVDPRVDMFAKNAPYTYGAVGKGLYNVASYAGGEYFKLQTYYQISEGSVEGKGLLGK
ncbi:aromatic prenyltransferase [Streptomyces sp. MMG1121]|uniref:aromatic prenyltransferase n=1 Tax=Streptomyces sp. MMG1121 TaxID=1415544 RepID=UPI0006BFA3C8|nr:aromatic prenyltransferase [Streptomyces sp. MMG1121]KOV57860.1 aromatic prenyltransferase [Streptomyces sp. MMG1121]